MTRARRSSSEVFICASYLLLLFQSAISRLDWSIPLNLLANYYDEIISVVFLVYLILHLGRKGIPRKYILDALIFFGFMFAGIIGSMLNNLQPLSAVIEDVIACSKFVLVFYGMIALSKNRQLTRTLENLAALSRVIITVLFCLVMLDELFPNRFFDSSIDSVTGLHSVQIFFYHPAVLAQVAALLLAVVSIDSSKRNLAYKVMALFIMVATLTSKALGFFFLYFFLCGYGRVKNIFGKLLLVGCALLCILFVSSDSLGAYYGNDQAARYTLLSDSLQIAQEHMPVGLGFGTFGSAAAASHYSPIYIQLGYLGHYGLGYVNTSFLTDTFWPVLLGEFGYLGTACYALLIWFLIKRSLLLFKIEQSYGVGALSIVGYLLICSVGATAFFNPVSVANALVLGLCLSQLSGPEQAKESASSSKVRPINMR